MILFLCDLHLREEEYQPAHYLHSWVTANLVFVIFGFLFTRKIIFGGEKAEVTGINFGICIDIFRTQFPNAMKMLILGIAALVAHSFDRTESL